MIHARRLNYATAGSIEFRCVKFFVTPHFDSWLNRGIMDVKILDEIPVFITKDGSEIRELLA